VPSLLDCICGLKPNMGIMTVSLSVRYQASDMKLFEQTDLLFGNCDNISDLV
jgi:hypothetical protein